LVLLVFLMKVGVVAACGTHDFSDASLAAAGQTAHAAASALDTGDDGDPPAPTTHGGCIDCHCHHAATLVSEASAPAWPMRSAEPPTVAARVHLVAPGQELRPPIL
jgi:hypothetical protein